MLCILKSRLMPKTMPFSQELRPPAVTFFLCLHRLVVSLPASTWKRRMSNSLCLLFSAIPVNRLVLFWLDASRVQYADSEWSNNRGCEIKYGYILRPTDLIKVRIRPCKVAGGSHRTTSRHKKGKDTNHS